MTADVIPLHAGQVAQPLALVDPAELERLRGIEDTLARPFVELVRELAHLRAVKAEAGRFVETVDLRKAAGWHKVPKSDLERLRSALNEEK